MSRVQFTALINNKVEMITLSTQLNTAVYYVNYILYITRNSYEYINDEMFCVSV